MRDPHVESLRYRLEASETTTYKNPPPVEYICDEFECRLDNGVLIVCMRKHYPTEEEARCVVENFLRSWEIMTALKLGLNEMWFKFEDLQLIDRNPQPSGNSQVIHPSSIVSAESFGLAKVHITRRKYPDPPIIFAVTPDVETLWQRYENYLNGKELLLPMAYFCLTVIENKANNRSKKRKNAAKRYKIDEKILDKLGELSSKRGDPGTARKTFDGWETATLSGKEKKWIEAAIKLLIQRTGELTSTRPIPLITMSDLPEI